MSHIQSFASVPPAGRNSVFEEEAGLKGHVNDSASLTKMAETSFHPESSTFKEFMTPP